MRRNLVVASWAGAAAVAVAAGVGAVALAQGGTLSAPTEPMSEDEVLAELESARANGPTAESPEPSTSPSADPPPSGELDQVPQDPGESEGTVLDDTGGSVLARCVDGGVELVWWVADQGWRISSVDPGPGEDAEVEFEHPDHQADWEVSCVGGHPEAQVETDRDDDDD